MKYEAIGFDWGGVINGEPGFVFDQKFCDLVGVSKEAYKEAYFQHNRSFNAGKPITETELWRRVLIDLGKISLLDDVVTFSKEYRSKKSINQPVLDLVDTLKEAGYKTGLLSNNTLEAAAMMRESGIDAHFDAFIVSAEVGMMKPDPEIYHLLCRQLEVDPKELIFIDDSRRSLSSAEACGFTPLLFTTYQQLVLDLRKLRIL